MSEEKRVVELDQYEHRAIVNIINDILRSDDNV